MNSNGASRYRLNFYYLISLHYCVFLAPWSSMLSVCYPSIKLISRHFTHDIYRKVMEYLRSKTENLPRAVHF